MSPVRSPRWLPTLVVLVLMSACANEPTSIEPEIVARFPHDPDAFTQGLLLADGRLYESTGLYGRSSLREVNPDSGEVIRIRHLPPELFGEGLALVDDRLIQLTWRAGVALIYDRETFELLGTFEYEGEGWGLCYDGSELWMSDGSATLAARDPGTFEVLRQIQVTSRGKPVIRLNELECVGDSVYANVWQSDRIVRVDKSSGKVDAEVDASDLLPPEERASLPAGAVLNGIAHDPQTGLFLVTGKLWPALLSVRFDQD